MKHLAANVLGLLIVVGIALGIAINWGKGAFEAPGPLAEASVVTVPKGAGLNEISTLLEEAGVIDDAMMFRLAAKYSGTARQLKFGEYQIAARSSLEDVLDQLARGDVISYRLTVAEGLSSAAVVALIDDMAVLEGEIAERPAEGSLAPDTYFVARGDTREQVIARMQAAQTRILEEAWAGRDEGLPLRSAEEALILASIVEKETGLDGERAKVASVFLNRLDRGMPLQSDPTVIYGITKGERELGRGIRRSELRRRTPWNTYTIPALPPTPIANPGRAAIEAVLAPETTPFVYFVADGTGGHAFASTLDEHNRNVARWRQIERQRRAQDAAEQGN
ncbi:MAG: endolytic transglycosylase MltG [Pseudomonadota bacterium]